ncbi:MAG: hypothetical protein Fues2KO_47580 [Fuerstiella sp.]
MNAEDSDGDFPAVPSSLPEDVSPEHDESEDEASARASRSRRSVDYVAATTGTVFGTIAGAAVFGFLLRQGIYAMVIPGTLIGLGCGGFAKGRSTGLGISAAIIAFVVSLGLEWHFRPFVVDDSLPYFLSHLRDLTTITWITVSLGTFAAFWFGRGR